MVHVWVLFCAYLLEQQAVLVCHVLRVLFPHCSIRQIGFVANQHDYTIRIGVLSYVIQPPPHVVEGFFLRDVVYYKRSNGSPIMTQLR